MSPCVTCKRSRFGNFTTRPAGGFAGRRRWVNYTSPSGAGWIIQIEGYHYYNGPDKGGAEGAAHVRKFLIDHFEFGEIELPGPNGEPTKYSLKELGVSFPVIAIPASISPAVADSCTRASAATLASAP